jgi:hypothetical protein
MADRCFSVKPRKALFGHSWPKSAAKRLALGEPAQGVLRGPLERSDTYP